LKLVPSNAVVFVLMGPNRGMRWVAGASSTHGSWLGNYESDHVAALPRLVRPGMVAYDVGTNVGYYTLTLSRLVGDHGCVYSFEPDARNVTKLHRHIELNRLSNVTIVQVAISDKAGLVGFQSQNEGGHISGASSYRVAAISLDEFIAAGHPEPSFLKMDIEGAERAALSGTVALLKKAEAVWMMATHTDELRRDCKEMMAQHGYHFTGFDCTSDPGSAADFIALPPNR
jgi:FkbM family methyltransferase